MSAEPSDISIDQPSVEKSVESTPAPDSTAAPETPQQNNDSESDNYGEFPPGTIVLAKLKSFPPWPAIVIPNDLVPEGVKKSKPKHPSQPRSSKKKSQHTTTEPLDTRIWCVRFLRDDTYMWGGVKDISLLSKEQIEKFLNGKKGKKLIKSAYEMALHPPDVEEFIIWGSNGKPIQIDNEADDADFEDDEDQSVEGDEDDDVDDEDGEDLEDLEDLKETKKRSKSKAKGGRGAKKAKKTIPKKQATPKAKPGKRGGRKKATPFPEPEPETSGDEDWDVDDESEPPVAIDIPFSKLLSDELKRRTPLVKRARITLQDFFLEQKDIETDSKSVKQISSTLDSLEKYPTIQTSLIKHYNLHKVLFDILKRPDLDSINKDIKSFRKRIENLVEIWFDAKIDPVDNWDFEEKEEVREETNGDGDEQKAEGNGLTENGVKEEQTEATPA